MVGPAVQASLCAIARGEPCHVFDQGEIASFFYEFEILQDLEVPSGGVEIQNDKGIIVHGKSTLEYGSDVPMRVISDGRLRFRQDMALEVAVGEYTFNVGMGMLPRHIYEHRTTYAHVELDLRLIRVCLLARVGQFAVVWRTHGKPLQLLHHGAANLPGQCQVMVELSTGMNSPVRMI
jgi:hypothetical protein